MRRPRKKARMRTRYVFEDSSGKRSEPVDVRGYKPAPEGVKEDVLNIIVISTPEVRPEVRPIESMTDEEVQLEVQLLEAEKKKAKASPCISRTP